jgi:CheY-like chemotaxis protein
MATKPQTSGALHNAERNPLIMVVDDDLHIRKMLRHLFEVDGHEVIEAEDGRAAWNIALSRHPAVLVTDLQMPGLDGFSLCRALRGAGFQRLGIIIYTGQPVTAEEIRDAGADELVLKTEPLSRLRDLVVRVLAN